MKKYFLAFSAAAFLCACGDPSISKAGIENTERNLNKGVREIRDHNDDVTIRPFTCSDKNGLTCTTENFIMRPRYSKDTFKIQEISFNTNWIYEGKEDVLTIDQVLKLMPSTYKFNVELKGIDLSGIRDFDRAISQLNNAAFEKMLSSPFDVKFSIEFDKDKQTLKGKSSATTKDGHEISEEMSGASLAHIIKLIKDSGCEIPMGVDFTSRASQRDVERFGRCMERSDMLDNKEELVAKLIPLEYKIKVNLPKLPAQANALNMFISDEKISKHLNKFINEGKIELQAELVKDIDIKSIKSPLDIIKKIKINGDDLTKEIVNSLDGAQRMMRGF